MLVGEVTTAVFSAAKAVNHADHSVDAFKMMSTRARQAVALHAAGRRTEAEALFADAERRQKSSQPQAPLLYSVAGYEYCDLLLAGDNWAAVLERGNTILKWEAESPSPSLLDRALLRLSLGRSHHGLALAVGKESGSSIECRNEVRASYVRLDEAVDALRRAGTFQHIPRGLLARAAFRHSIGDWDGARRDLDEVLEIAEPGPMKLFLCDMALGHARLAFAQIEAFAPLNGMTNDSPRRPGRLSDAENDDLKQEAAQQLATADDYIESCGYHLRGEELAELQAVLRGERKFADLPPRV